MRARARRCCESRAPPRARVRVKGLPILSKSISSLCCGCALAAAFLVTTAAEAAPQEDDVEISAEPTKKPAAPAQAPKAAAAATAPATAAAAPAPTSPPATIADLQSLAKDIEELRERLDNRRSAPVVEVKDPSWSATTPWDTPGREGIWVTAYMQSQYESHQDSDDQLREGGALLNQNRFLVRRARIRLIGEWEYAATQIEINGDTTKGFAFGLQKAEASLRMRLDPKHVPIVQATVGLFDTPVGYELVESPRTRHFMERTAASRAFWPGEPDLGMRFSGGIGFFRWTIAALNGNPIGDKQYPGQDPLSAKDVIVRFGVDTKPRENLAISGNVSALRGKGFHAGTDATKGTVEWHDLNEDGVVQPYELQAVPSAAATPSSSFDHWVIGADIEAQYTSKLGKTRLTAEAMVGENMDRALFVADPVLTSIDSRELAWNVGITQEITPYALIGFRYDYYDPNSDAFDKRQGRLLPYSQRIKTYSPIFGVVLPDRAKLLFQYDITRNFLARDLTGVPANLKMNAWTLRLQVEL